VPLLGRPFRIEGVVAAGEGRGRALGFPTANITAAEGQIVPADGVYAGWLVRLRRADGAPVGDDEPDRRLPAAISVGTNPTFDGVGRRVEAYALDRDDLELYGEQVGVEFVDRLRGMERFASLDGLLAAMADDVRRARDALGQPRMRTS
jgi:riboflavin kinase/FMN adenylyltransferase